MKFFNRFFKDRKGAVSTEFVFLLPLWVAMLMGSFVCFDALLMYNKASKANATVANLVSRVGTVNTAFTDNLFQVYKNVGYGNNANAWMRLSVVRNENNSFRVRWSEARGLGSDTETAWGVLKNDSPLLAAYIPEVVNGDEWVLLETSRHFEPLLGNFGIAKTNFHNHTVFIPRFTGQLTHATLTDFDENYDGSTEPGNPHDTADMDEQESEAEWLADEVATNANDGANSGAGNGGGNGG
ncbi:hypothetical protein GCM10008927_06940 [Amylibacter ulvae]|uniref:Pilus assembly protein n=1 Tax=Paramylibacter ulvae TaxID=1651968 RepID=A0ABQ3CUN0_9RHOB|nr:TadE/TadG family type IV pilus assembly protein [Amylibacter ulvae]GHA44687.1 hypothetical protein GCM10008927_06940 [Amylibacter ulvae]